MWAVKLCSSKILQFLTGGAGNHRIYPVYNNNNNNNNNNDDRLTAFDPGQPGYILYSG